MPRVPLISLLLEDQSFIGADLFIILFNTHILGHHAHFNDIQFEKLWLMDTCKCLIVNNVFVYQFSFVETPRKFIIAMINLRGFSTKLN